MISFLVVTFRGRASLQFVNQVLQHERGTVMLCRTNRVVWVASLVASTCVVAWCGQVEAWAQQSTTSVKAQAAAKPAEDGITTMGAANVQRSFRVQEIKGIVQTVSSMGEADALKRGQNVIALLQSAARKMGLSVQLQEQDYRYGGGFGGGGGGFGGGGFGKTDSPNVFKRNRGDGTAGATQDEYVANLFFTLSLRSNGGDLKSEPKYADAVASVRALVATGAPIIDMQALAQITEADAQTARKAVVEDAVADALAKAKVLAKAAKADKIQLLALRELGQSDVERATVVNLGAGAAAVAKMQSSGSVFQQVVVWANVEARYQIVAPVVVVND